MASKGIRLAGGRECESRRRRKWVDLLYIHLQFVNSRYLVPGG